MCAKTASEPSGGMIKRAALARSLALDPEIVFLDEPLPASTPSAPGDFDDLIMALQETLGFHRFMVSHDLDSLHTVCDQIAALSGGKVIAVGTINSSAGIERSLAAILFPREAGERPVNGKKK